jgi:dipeptidyl aminopeptidase/acylaminoacyl peptidase
MAVMLRLRFVSSFDHRGTLARIPPLGGAARELLHDVHGADWSPDGARLAVVRDKDGLMRLEYPIGTVLHQTAGWIGAFRIAPDGEHVAFLDHQSRTSDDGSIVLVGTDGSRRVLSEGWGTARGLAWAMGGREVWFTADRAGSARGLYAVNLEGVERRVLQVASNLTVGDVAPDGRVLLTHGPERAGISGLSPGESRERDLSWLDWSLLHDLTEDGRMMLVSESAEGGGDAGSIYVRPIDGSPAVRIGDGLCLTFAPDGEWVLALRRTPDPGLVLLPTGVGEPQPIATPPLRIHFARFLPDGRRFVALASEPGRAARLHLVDLGTGNWTPFGPEGLDPLELHVLPSGDRVVGMSADQGYRAFPIDGGEPEALPPLARDERIVRWGSDGRSILVWRLNEIPARVFRLDLESGERTLWRELTPPDPTGIYRIGRLNVSADGSAYAYTYYLHLIDLHVVEGLR